MAGMEKKKNQSLIYIPKAVTFSSKKLLGLNFACSSFPASTHNSQNNRMEGKQKLCMSRMELPRQRSLVPLEKALLLSLPNHLCT
jgi:hypothetical protein